jgi:hypothetical protein
MSEGLFGIYVLTFDIYTRLPYTRAGAERGHGRNRWTWKMPREDGPGVCHQQFQVSDVRELKVWI